MSDRSRLDTSRANGTQRMLALCIYVSAAVAVLMHGTIYYIGFSLPISLCFVVAGFKSLTNFDKGRELGLAALVTTGIFVIMLVRFLVPAPSGQPWVWHYSLGVFVLYCGAVIFNCFIPSRFRYSVAVLIFCIGIPTTAAVGTLVLQWKDGIYSRPTTVHFKWHPGPETLNVRKNEYGIISPEIYALLKAQGIKGELVWTGGNGNQQNDHRMIIIASQPPKQSVQLHYAHEKNIVYVYDGDRWSQIPLNAELYESAVTIVPEGNATLIRIPNGYGNWTGSGMYTWKNTKRHVQ